jgi:hypothetical protein
MTEPRSAPRSTRIDRLSQRTRRLLAAGTLIGLPAMYAWSSFWLSTSVSNLLWGPISFVLIGLTAIGSLVLYRYVRDRAAMPGRTLDERERQLRDQAWILAYVVLSTVVVIAVGIVAITVLVFQRNVQLDGTLVSALALTVGVLIPVLPVATLAWIEPDPPADD